jgi:dynein heavy chain 1, cytosolic
MTPIHEIKIRDQQLIMEPTVQEMRAFWYKQLNGIVSIICSQKKIESMKYEKGGRINNTLTNDDFQESPTFKSALKQINQEIMMAANRKIEEAIRNAASYVSISGCQALWNVDFTKLYEKLEGDVQKWHQCLGGLKILIKRNFDSAETIKHFGAVVIDYQKAQDQVNNRFNSLQDQIIRKLYEHLSKQLSEFYQTLTKAKNQLELVSLDNPNIDVTIFITEIQEKSRSANKWERELEDTYETGVNVLKK